MPTEDTCFKYRALDKGGNIIKYEIMYCDTYNETIGVTCNT